MQRIQPNGRNWRKRTKHERRAIEANRKRMKSKKGKNLQRQRSEKVDRSFAHVLETGDSRRTRLRGAEKVHKRHLIGKAAYNIGIVMRLLFGIGTARGLQRMARAILACLNTLPVRLWPYQTLQNRSTRKIDINRGLVGIVLLLADSSRRRTQISVCSTGC